MEYRILGPLEVRAGDRTVDITGRVQPRLLAALLLDAGRTVPLHRLIDTVWGDNPPDTARRQIQNTMSRLRRLLADGDGSILQAVGHGYRIHSADIELDADRFAADTRRARELAAAEQPAAALQLLQGALARWRGPALAGITGRGIDAGAQRLDEARLVALEERIALELRLNHTVSVIGELNELLDQHPHRQSFTSLLMLALHRDGRTVEALDVYESVRRSLAEELGIDPGAPLRRTHSAILRDDASLAVDRPAAGGAVLGEPGNEAEATVNPTPAQLPADIAGFTGREAQLSELDTLLAEGGRTAVLSTIAGSGGTGKTALAVHWAHRNRRDFADGQLYINLHGFDRDKPVSAIDALDRLIHALNPALTLPTDLDAAASLYRSLLSQRRMLVILDNAHSVEQVRPLLPGSACFTIVTSRHRLSGLTAIDDAHPIGVASLNHSDSLELLANIVGTDRLHGGGEAGHRLARMCGGLPLALRIAGANLLANPRLSVADFLSSWESGERLERLAVDGDPDAAVIGTFDHSYRHLDPAARQLFLRLGLLPGDDFSAALATAIAPEPAATAQLLSRLENAHLIEQHRLRRYRLHDLIRLYALHRADAELGRQAIEDAKTTAIDWYSDNRYHPDSGEPGNVVAAFQAWQHHRHSWRLVQVMPDFVRHGYNLVRLRGFVETGLRHSTAAGDDIARSQMLDAMAQIHMGLGDEETALDFGRKAVSVARLTPGGDTVGRLRGNLALMLLCNSHYGEAAKLLPEAIGFAEAAGDTIQLINSLVLMGATLRALGGFSEAEHHLRRAKRLADDWPQPISQQVTAGYKLARLYIDMGRLDDAAALIEAIEVWWRRHNSDFNRDCVLWLRGELHRRRGDLAAAERDLADSWELAHQAGRDGWTLHVRFSQINLLCEAGRYGQAREYLDEVEPARGEDFERDDRAVWSMLHARVHNGLDQHSVALPSAKRALELFLETGSPLRQARAMHVLADAHDGVGNRPAAERYRRREHQICARLGLSELEPAPSPHREPDR